MSHSTKEKQVAIIKIVDLLYPKFTVKFDMSQRAKNLFGQCWHRRKLIKFYRPLFQHTISACLRCALHEIAHIMQHEISGYSKHDKQFEDILNMLIEDYGSMEIAAAKKNKDSLAYSDYEKEKDD